MRRCFYCLRKGMRYVRVSFSYEVLDELFVYFLAIMILTMFFWSLRFVMCMQDNHIDK